MKCLICERSDPGLISSFTWSDPRLSPICITAFKWTRYTISFFILASGCSQEYLSPLHWHPKSTEGVCEMSGEFLRHKTFPNRCHSLGRLQLCNLQWLVIGHTILLNLLGSFSYLMFLKCSVCDKSMAYHKTVWTQLLTMVDVNNEVGHNWWAIHWWFFVN